MFCLKVFVGYFIGLWYALNGCRSKILRYYDQPGTCLAIVGHNPDPVMLERLLKWYLRRGFTFINPNTIESLPKGRIAWLSFDDGWLSFQKAVLPVLEKLDVPATLFVAPHETEQGFLWTNGLRPFIGQGRIKEMYNLSHEERQKVVDAYVGMNVLRRELLDKEQVVSLSRHPLVDVQNHTFSHMSCSHRPAKEVVAEVLKANRILKEWTGKECRMVCYPFCHATRESDMAIRALGMIPVRGDAGEGSIERIGMTRNMFRDRGSLQENIGRTLNAWCRVVVPS